MAWPRSPMRTYIANGVPVIAADDLNGLQLWVNALTLDEVTITGLALDGVGGAANTPEPNFIRWTNTAGGGNPASNAGCLNELRPLNVPKAWFRFKTLGAGAVSYLDGDNVFSVSCVAGTSMVQVQFQDAMANANYSVTSNGASVVAGVVAVCNPCMYPSIGPDAARVPTTTTFCLLFPDGFRPDTGTVECEFHVFGRQTS